MSDTPPFKDYQANSRKAKERPEAPPPKKIEKVISGEAVQKKPGVGHKFKNIFVNGDFKNFVLHQLFWPAMKGIGWDILMEGGRQVFGDRSMNDRQYRNWSGGPTPQTRYDRGPSRMWSPQNDPPYRPGMNEPRYGQPRREEPLYVVPTRDDAEATLESMATMLEQYDNVSMADLHEMLGLSIGTVDTKWGWTHLTGANFHSVRDGYVLDLPPLEAIPPSR